MSDIIIDNQNNKYKTDSDKKSEKQTNKNPDVVYWHSYCLY